MLMEPRECVRRVTCSTINKKNPNSIAETGVGKISSVACGLGSALLKSIFLIILKV